MRRFGREVVFKILYAKAFGVDDNDELFNDLSKEFKLTNDDIVFAKNLLKIIEDNQKEIDDLISEYALNYTLDRVYPTDRCALNIGIAEMKYCSDVPNIVAIDEALYLCKTYSTENSLNFVNGIFAKIKLSLENKGENNG